MTARSTGRWAGSCSRSSASEHFQRDVVDPVEVEDEALGLEQLLHARELQRHLGGADGECPELERAVFVLEVVVAADALDAERLGRRIVDDDLGALPAAAAEDLQPGR